jgi:sortase (surface protein transpeptidase)
MHVQLLAGFSLGCLVGGCLMWGLLVFFSAAPVWVAQLPVWSVMVPESTTATGTVPTTLRIPAVGIDTTFAAPLGLNEDATIEVPERFDAVGWYQFGPVPGDIGPAVVLGHVDSKLGPAVLYPLRSLQVGDEIHIARSDGTTTTFVTERITYTTQEAFPTNAVYGDTTYPGLRLVTCSGTFDTASDRYTHNLIVYALASTT